MSAENKKLVWIAVAVSVFVLVLAVVGVLFFAPKKGTGAAPATIGNIAPPKASDPQDYLSAPPQSMPTETAPNKNGDVIVIYGDNPQSLEPAATSPGLDDTAALQAAAQAAGGQQPAGANEPATRPVAGTAASGTGTAAATQQPAAAPKTTGTAKPAAASPAKTAATAKPATTQAPAAKPAATKPADQYWIQAASFSSRGKADELKEKLASKGMASIITVKDINGKSWYRVRIGPWSTNAEASGWLTKIKSVSGCEESVIWKEGAPAK